MSISLMRRITYLQKFRSFVLSIPILNPTQTRRLVRKCDSIDKSESLKGYLREGNSRHYSTAPAHKGDAVNQDEATIVVKQERVQRVIYFFWYMRESPPYLISYMLLVMTASRYVILLCVPSHAYYTTCVPYKNTKPPASAVLRHAEIRTEIKTVGEGGGRGYLHTENNS
jgi:hypothetical protein